MHIPILTEVQNEHECHQKDKVFLLKSVVFFRDVDHLHANGLFCVLTIYLKLHLFHFLSGGIRMHIAVLSGIQNGYISRQKNSHVSLNTFFLKFISEINATIISIGCSIC